MKAMILAAGRGERMRPLTDHTPKPLLAVNGKPLIEYHLEKLAQQGIREVVINHAWLGEKIEHNLGDGSRWNLAIHYSPESAGGLETAGGIINALPLLGQEPFWLINGDIWTDICFSRLPKQLGDGDLAHLLMVENPPHHPEGDFSVQQGRLCRTDNGKASYTYSGMGLYSPDWFRHRPVEKLPLRPLFDAAIEQRKMAATIVTEGHWVDVGTPARLAQLDTQLRGEDDLG